MSKTNSNDVCFASWPTAWGVMGGVWGAKGLRRIVLPHYQPKDLLDLLAFEHPQAAQNVAPFEPLIALCRDYFNGKLVDFSAVPCELPPTSTLSGQVLAQCRLIEYGKTRSYSAIAQLIGRPDAARAVAAALGKNAIPLVVPCHRVMYADGRLGGFSALGGVEVKKRMLELEKKCVVRSKEESA